ncbi:MAG: formate dehydrogenase subunit alpha [Caenispirillum bisanense]|nr:formate dehydrogenase subunit alpha [Caenispirillum bisanense]MCA1972809.1 formate dehydrogenase subunit alpha [Caenispirillum sp.]
MTAFTLNGQSVEARPGETIWQVADRLGVTLPHLCYRDEPGYRQAKDGRGGNCRACLVEIEGERTLAASCIRTPTAGMVVTTESARAEKSRALVLELLGADQPATGERSRVHHWLAEAGIDRSRFPARRHAAPPLDASHPAMRVNLEACIQCGLCTRACRDVQVNDVIGFAGRGMETTVVFDTARPMGDSTCVGCGECVQACPTDALLPASRVAEPAQTVDTVCPYCGVGCQVRLTVEDNRIVEVEGRNGPANENRLCVKGRFGMDYVHHPQRLTVPLVRKDGAPKTCDMDPANPWTHFREATWEEALERAAEGLRRIRDGHGGGALAGFGSAKGSNEEAYLFQKLVRTGFGTNNVDHCTRLCHASSVAALMEMVGSGAVTAPVRECANAEVIVVIGANPTVNHPVGATHIKNAVKNGARLVVMDPRGQALSRHATWMLQFNPGTDVALLNSLMHVVIAEGLHDRAFVAERLEGFEVLKQHVSAFSPELMAPITGIAPEVVREVARAFATARGAMVFWGMGLSQHAHGTDNARCLIDLTLLCGHVGKPGSGLHPLRGQNNVQGASDAGLIPMVYPDYQPVEDAAVRGFYEDLWDTPLDPHKGLTVVEIMHAASAGRIKGLYVMGENPAMSDPDLVHTRASLAALDHMVVQDIFLTETAMLADVVLPASAFPEKTGTFTNTDRLVQMGRAALTPPGAARQDLAIIQEMGRRLGLAWDYAGPAEVFEEMRACMPSIAGISWQRLEREGAVTYPCAAEDEPGKAILFDDVFPLPGGKARLKTADVLPPAELPDADYPLVLTTGRVLEHWHTGAMTRRATTLEALEGEPHCLLAPATLARLGMGDGGPVRLTTRRGTIQLAGRPDPQVPEGIVFVPFCYTEAAANLLTNPALDPTAKIPEFKFAAVRVEADQAAGVSPAALPS